MKKIALLLTILLCTFVASPVATAQTAEKQVITIDALMKQLKDAENADYINISPFLMSIAKTMAETPEEKEMFKIMKSMRILSYKECSEQDKAKFAQAVSSANLKDFIDIKTLAQELGIEDENIEEEIDKDIYIYFKTKNKKITRLVMMQAGPESEDYIITDMNCNMSMDDFLNMQEKDAFGKQPGQ